MSIINTNHLVNGTSAEVEDVKPLFDVLGAAVGLLSKAAMGRLTLTSGAPVTTDSVTAATTLYYTPYIGNVISLYDPSLNDWLPYVFTEISLSLSGLAATTNYDIFIYDNGGTLTLEAVAWSNNTTRATAITRQDGVLVKSGTPARRYLGTIRTTSTIGQCEMSATRWFVWNYYNRVERRLFVESASSHTYNSATVRPWNGDTTLRLEAVVGVVEDMVSIDVMAQIFCAVANNFGHVGFGIDSTTTYDGNQRLITGSTNLFRAGVGTTRVPTLGYSFYQLLQTGNATNAPTFDFATLTLLGKG